MKNTEWGAVAYLSHSAYGIKESIRLNNNNDRLTGFAATKEPTCGYQETNEECNRYGTTADITQPYNSVTGYLGSTTGNITRIYDMAGMRTQVMAIMMDSNGNPVSGENEERNSGFNGTYTSPDSDNASLATGTDYPDKRYYDLYLAEQENYNATFYRRILGDATGEMGPFGEQYYYNTMQIQISSWYSDIMNQYFTNTYSFATRGYHYDGGTYSGIFSFQGGYGRATGSASSFRIILTP